MKERGFLPDFSKAALDELENLQRDDWRKEAPQKDLCHLL